MSGKELRIKKLFRGKKNLVISALDHVMSYGDQPGIEELITLSEAVKISGLSPSHLRLLVSKGTIWGKKLGRHWFTTAQAVNEYLNLDHKPGPKPRKEE